MNHHLHHYTHCGVALSLSLLSFGVTKFSGCSAKQRKLPRKKVIFGDACDKSSSPPRSSLTPRRCSRRSCGVLNIARLLHHWSERFLHPSPRITLAAVCETRARRWMSFKRGEHRPVSVTVLQHQLRNQNFSQVLLKFFLCA